MGGRWEKNKAKQTTERECLMCGKKVQMAKFQRYCSAKCRDRATEMESSGSANRYGFCLG